MVPIYFIPLILFIPIVLWIAINENMELRRLQTILSKLDIAIKINGLHQLKFYSSKTLFYGNKSRLIYRIENNIDLLLKNYSSKANIHFPLRHLVDENRKYKQLERKIDKLLNLTGTEILISPRIKCSIWLFSNIQILDEIIKKIDILVAQIKSKSVRMGLGAT